MREKATEDTEERYHNSQAGTEQEMPISNCF